MQLVYLFLIPLIDHFQFFSIGFFLLDYSFDDILKFSIFLFENFFQMFNRLMIFIFLWFFESSFVVLVRVITFQRLAIKIGTITRFKQLLGRCLSGYLFGFWWKMYKQVFPRLLATPNFFNGSSLRVFLHWNNNNLRKNNKMNNQLNCSYKH